MKDDIFEPNMPHACDNHSRYIIKQIQKAPTQVIAMCEGFCSEPVCFLMQIHELWRIWRIHRTVLEAPLVLSMSCFMKTCCTQSSSLHPVAVSRQFGHPVQVYCLPMPISCSLTHPKHTLCSFPSPRNGVLLPWKQSLRQKQGKRCVPPKLTFQSLNIKAIQGGQRPRRLVDAIRIIPEFSRNYFKSPFRRALFGGISLLGGFYVAQTISLSFGALGVNDVIAAVLCVIVTEYVTKFYYTRTKVTFPVALLNNFKMGFTYGLFIDAFKLASWKTM